MNSLIATRGERNNNPGNIERVPGTVWKGQDPDQSGDSRFVKYIKPVFGIRALARILMTYSRLYPQDTPQDIDTVSEIISRWAPPKKGGVVENNTAAYIRAVAAHLGVDPNATIDIADESIMQELVRAIIIHENGRCIYGDAEITDGVQRALS